jgi:hypothetical protein
MIGREDYEERRQARIDRLNSSAEREAGLSADAYRRSHDLVKNIPFGQPNISGRTALPNLRAKSMNAMDQSLEHDAKAAYYADKAAVAERNNAISSDDPEAIEKLEQKIERLKKKQAFMKGVNKYYRKHKTCVGFDGLSDEKAQEFDASMKKAYSWETAPFPAYKLTSINQRIKATQARIEKLQRIDAIPAMRITFNGGEIESDNVTNRVIIRFNERQGDDVTAALKANGFNWAPSVKAWQRLRNMNALAAACRVCGVSWDEVRKDMTSPVSE